MPAAVNLIEDNSLRVTADGFKINVRENWYRSLPLSCIEKVTISVDGVEIPPRDIWFGNNKDLHSLQDLEKLTGEYWYVQDSASLHVKWPGMMTAGKTYTIEVEITLRAPYIMVGPGKFLSMLTKHSSVQVAE
jgi:hypothetical protein